MSSVRIVKDPHSRSTQILVDDFDVAAATRGYVLHCDSPAHMPTLELTLNVFEIDTQGEADVWISKTAQELLLRFGWTPPPEPDLTAEVPDAQG